MTTFLLSTMLLLTIVAAFAFGVAAGYWVILCFLEFFQSRTNAQQAGIGSRSGAQQRRLVFCTDLFLQPFVTGILLPSLLIMRSC